MSTTFYLQHSTEIEVCCRLYDGQGGTRIVWDVDPWELAHAMGLLKSLGYRIVDDEGGEYSIYDLIDKEDI